MDDYLSLLAPAPARPSKIVGIGRSFRDHAAELGNEVPGEPLIFLKAPSTLLAPGGMVRLPKESDRVDFEGEFALVIGKPLSDVGTGDALEGVLGVTLACDVTARDLQKKDRTFARAKSFDTFCPIGPRLTVNPPWDELEFETKVNGEQRQHGRSADLIWSFAELVSYVSGCMTLLAGDLILTGTPAGVGPLEAGDRVTIESRSIGVLEFTVEEEAP